MLRFLIWLIGTTCFCATLFLRPFAVAQETPPPPATTVVWQTDWETARRKAVQENKPLFVRFRCFKMPPDLAALDAQIERPAPGSPLEELLTEKFVPVRIGSIKNVDLNTFQFDYDLQLAGLVLDGRDRSTIARWGTRDSQSAAGRISLDGLTNTLQQSADNYLLRTPVTENLSKATVPPPRTLDRAYPAFANSKRASEPCWHCHYVNDARIAQEKAAGTLRKRALFMYPLPESVGIRFDKNENNVVSGVRPNSPAQKAGLHVGNVVVRADIFSVYSSADFQFVLQNLPHQAVLLMLDVQRSRDIREINIKTLHLAPGWRETEDISWRPSQGAVPPILGTWETPLTKDERKAARLPETRSLALRVSFVFAGEKWAASHGDLQVGDVIVAVNGQSPPIDSARQFHTWYRLHNEVGQTAKFSVLRNGKRLTVPVSCVDVSL